MKDEQVLIPLENQENKEYNNIKNLFSDEELILMSIKRINDKLNMKIKKDNIEDIIKKKIYYDFLADDLAIFIIKFYKDPIEKIKEIYYETLLKLDKEYLFIIKSIYIKIYPICIDSVFCENFKITGIQLPAVNNFIDGYSTSAKYFASASFKSGDSIKLLNIRKPKKYSMSEIQLVPLNKYITISDDIFLKMFYNYKKFQEYNIEYEYLKLLSIIGSFEEGYNNLKNAGILDNTSNCFNSFINIYNSMDNNEKNKLIKKFMRKLTFTANVNTITTDILRQYTLIDITLIFGIFAALACYSTFKQAVWAEASISIENNLKIIQDYSVYSVFNDKITLPSTIICLILVIISFVSRYRLSQVSILY